MGGRHRRNPQTHDGSESITSETNLRKTPHVINEFAQNPARYQRICAKPRTLSDVLARIVTRRDGDPLADLLPGRWVDTKAAETTFESSYIAVAA
jgi:hypothetical protein